MNPYASLTAEQAAVLRALEDAGARTPQSAVTLHSLHIAEDHTIASLVELGIVCRADENSREYYATLSRNVFGPRLWGMSRRPPEWTLYAALSAFLAGLALLVIRLRR